MMHTFVRLTLLITLGIVAVVVLFFVVKAIIIAAIVAALVIGVLFVANFFRRKAGVTRIQNPPSQF